MSIDLRISLSEKALESINRIKELGGYESIVDVIRHSLADELFLVEKRSKGWTFLARKGKKYREIVWPE